MDTWYQVLIVALSSIAGSSGLWVWLQKKDKTKSATTRLLMGMAYDKITYLGMRHIERGWITKDELSDFRKHFFEPYQELGGNGVAAKFMEEVDKLPLRSHSQYAAIAKAVLKNQGDPND